MRIITSISLIILALFVSSCSVQSTYVTQTTPAQNHFLSIIESSSDYEEFILFTTYDPQNISYVQLNTQNGENIVSNESEQTKDILNSYPAHNNTYYIRVQNAGEYDIKGIIDLTNNTMPIFIASKTVNVEVTV